MTGKAVAIPTQKKCTTLRLQPPPLHRKGNVMYPMSFLVYLSKYQTCQIMCIVCVYGQLVKTHNMACVFMHVMCNILCKSVPGKYGSYIKKIMDILTMINTARCVCYVIFTGTSIIISYYIKSSSITRFTKVVELNVTNVGSSISRWASCSESQKLAELIAFHISIMHTSTA